MGKIAVWDNWVHLKKKLTFVSALLSTLFIILKTTDVLFLNVATHGNSADGMSGKPIILPISAIAE